MAREAGEIFASRARAKVGRSRLILYMSAHGINFLNALVTCLISLAAIFASCFFFGVAAAQTDAKMVETRAVYVHPENQFSTDPATGKQEIRHLVESLAQANFNLIFPWVRSEYLAALTDTSYQQKVPIAKWDALGELVRVAHEKGMQVHLWYSFTHYKSVSSPDFDPKHGGSPEWAAKKLDELVPNQITGQVVPPRIEDVCPNHPEARIWEENQIYNALGRYPLISGVTIEEPGYGSRGYCVCALCRQIFQQAHGLELSANLDAHQAEDLRCQGTTAFMERLQRDLNRRRLILSTGGGYDWKNDRRLGRDWRRWAQLGWLNFYLPQIYVTQLDEFGRRLQKTLIDLRQDCLVFPVIAAHRNTPEMVVQQIYYARQLGAPGVVLFPAKSLTYAYLTALREGPFKVPAIPKYR